MPMQPRRSCLKRTQYRICRTWFFELLFTLLPLLLMSLIIAGLFAFETVSRQVTTDLLYRHAMAPVTVTLRRYFDQKLALVNYVGSVVEQGRWTDTISPDATAEFVVPYYSHSTVSAVSQVEITSFGDDRTHYFTSQYNGLPHAPRYAQGVSSYLQSTPSALIVRDRFLLDGVHAPNIAPLDLLLLSYVAPNATESTYTGTPWDDTAFARCPVMPCFIFNDVTSLKRQFGVRFEAPLLPEIVSATATPRVSQIFMTINATTAFARLLPPCAIGVQAMIVDFASLQVPYYNCDPSMTMLTDLTVFRFTAAADLMGPGNPYSPLVAVSRIPQFTSDSTIPYYLVTINNITGATTCWDGHNLTLKSIGTYIDVKLGMVQSMASHVRVAMPTLSAIEPVERFFASVLISNPFVTAIYQFLPAPPPLFAGRNLMKFELANNAWGDRILRTSIYSNFAQGIVSTARNYATAGASDGLTTTITPSSPSWMVARVALESGDASFLQGFDTVTSLVSVPIPFQLPYWAQWLGTLSFPTAPLANVTGGVVTLYRAAVSRLPLKYWFNPMVAPVVCLRYSFVATDLVYTMTTLLGQSATDGAVFIVDDALQVITYAGGGASKLNSFNLPEPNIKITLADFNNARNLLQVPCSSADTTAIALSSVCDPVTKERLGYSVTTQTNYLKASDVIIVSKLMSFSVIEGHWYVLQQFPATITSSVGSTDKIFGAGALFLALIFLIMNVIYVVIAINGTVDLKRFMRRIAQGEASAISDGAISLSSNTEVREIELAVLKIKKAAVEYAKFLPRGLERYEEDAETVMRSHQAEQEGLVAVPMTAIGPTSAAAAAEAPAMSPGRSYTDILMRHQTGAVSRSVVAVVSLDLVDATAIMGRISSAALAALLTKLGGIFHATVQKLGGMSLPMNAGAARFTAVWTHSATKKVKELASVAAANIGSLVTETIDGWISRRQYPPLQCIVSVTSGNAELGLLGDVDASKITVFTGPVFSTAAKHLNDLAKIVRETIKYPVDALAAPAAALDPRDRLCGYPCLVAVHPDTTDDGVRGRVVCAPLRSLAHGLDAGDAVLGVAPAAGERTPEMIVAKFLIDSGNGIATRLADLEDALTATKSKLANRKMPTIAAVINNNGSAARATDL